MGTAVAQNIERIGLTGALIVAVGVLWRAKNLQEKDFREELVRERKASKEEAQMWAERNRADSAAQQGRLDKKDEQVLLLLRSTAELMVSTSDTNKELRTTVQASIEAKRELSVAINELHTTLKSRPCLADTRFLESTRRA